MGMRPSDVFHHCLFGSLYYCVSTDWGKLDRTHACSVSPINPTTNQAALNTDSHRQDRSKQARPLTHRDAYGQFWSAAHWHIQLQPKQPHGISYLKFKIKCDISNQANVCYFHQLLSSEMWDILHLLFSITLSRNSISHFGLTFVCEYFYQPALGLGRTREHKLRSQTAKMTVHRSPFIQ